MMNPFGNNENTVQVQIFSGFGISFLRVAKESNYEFLCVLYDLRFFSLNKYSKYVYGSQIKRNDKIAVVKIVTPL